MYMSKYPSNPALILPVDSYNEKNTYSKNTFFEHDDYGHEPSKERSLWQSVITQVIIDATCAPVNARTRREKTQSIMWLSMHNEDFLMVCELADMNPIRIIKGAKRLIKQSTANHRRKLRMKRIRKNAFQDSGIKGQTPEIIKAELLRL